MAEIDRKIADKVLQLSSHSEELKRVVEQTNQKNKELEELNLKQKQIKEYLERAESEFQNFKNKNLTEESRHQEQIKIFKAELDLKQKGIDSMLSFISKLETDKGTLRGEIKVLEESKLELVAFKDKLKELKEKQIVYNKLVSDIDKVVQQKDGLDKKILELNIKVKNLQDKLDSVKVSHREWLKETKTKAEQTLDSSIDRINNLEKTKRDLRIVVKRLKKVWEQKSSSPFPKIYDARSGTGN